MPGETLILQAAENAIEQELNKLPPTKRDAIFGGILGVAGLAVCVFGISRLIKALQQPKQQPA